MNLEKSRDFKGVWIPKGIYLDNRLTALEKIVLVEIDSLDSSDGCFCSNDYLAEFCQCSERKISDTIAKLTEIGYITVENFDGRKRILHSRVCKAEQGRKNCEAASQKVRGRVEKTARQSSRNCEADGNIHYISNNINNNIDITYPASAMRDAEVDSFFEDMWKLYPRKKDKSAVSKSAKLRLYKAGREKVVAAIERYKQEIEREHRGTEYIKYGGSFFNKYWQDYVTDDDTPSNVAETTCVPKRRMTTDEIEKIGGTY